MRIVARKDVKSVCYVRCGTVFSEVDRRIEPKNSGLHPRGSHGCNGKTTSKLSRRIVFNFVPRHPLWFFLRNGVQTSENLSSKILLISFIPLPPYIFWGSKSAMCSYGILAVVISLLDLSTCWALRPELRPSKKKGRADFHEKKIAWCSFSCFIEIAFIKTDFVSLKTT